MCYLFFAFAYYDVFVLYIYGEAEDFGEVLGEVYRWIYSFFLLFLYYCLLLFFVMFIIVFIIVLCVSSVFVCRLSKKIDGTPMAHLTVCADFFDPLPHGTPRWHTSLGMAHLIVTGCMALARFVDGFPGFCISQWLANHEFMELNLPPTHRLQDKAGFCFVLFVCFCSFVVCVSILCVCCVCWCSFLCCWFCLSVLFVCIICVYGCLFVVRVYLYLCFVCVV